LKELETDEAAADREEGFVDVVSALVADAQPPVLVQPGDRALDDPPLPSKPGTVAALRPGDLRLNVTVTQLPAALARVVGTVAVQAVRPTARAAAPSAHWWDRINQGDQLGDVVAVAAGERAGQRRAAAAGDYVMLGAASCAVDRAGTGLGAPPNARTCELSIAARDQSIRSASCSF
jgi:hypothetical protein